MKKAFIWILFLMTLALLFLLFLEKPKLEKYIGKELKSQMNAAAEDNTGRMIDSLYDYSRNGQPFTVTYLEFGSVGCVACKKMELVMQKTREAYAGRVHVVFLNILKPENQTLMKYYGVAVIPTQVLLDRNGKEFYRHTGFISSDELWKEFDDYLTIIDH